MSRPSLPLAALPAITLLSACASKQPPAVDQSHFTAQERRLIASTPVIDVHTHTFNARFLPIRNITLGKRDKAGFASIFITDRVALIAAYAILHATEYSQVPTSSEADREIANGLNAATARDPEIANLNVTPEEVATNPGVTGMRKMLREGKKEREISFTERVVLQRAVSAFSNGGGLLPLKTDDTSETRHFLSCLTAPQERLEYLFQSDHRKDGRVVIDLNVSHMMDMAPTYDGRESSNEKAELYDFRNVQIGSMERQQRAAAGRELYFVAYSPFRDTWSRDPRSGPGEALRIVRDAYEKCGAFGVKVYPPSGYAPSGNSIPSYPWSISRQPGEQWRARYRPEGRPPVTGTDLDSRLDELCQWASTHDVPLFAHCGQGEFEARSGYHNLAHPKGWEAVLKKYPNLRLCLAHAGNDGEWYDTRSTDSFIKSTWGGAVYQLCRDYKNVYCDFACQEEIADPVKRAAFTSRMRDLIEQSRKDNREQGRGWDFSDKIMYGSDWFMPMEHASDRLNFLLAFQSAIYDAGGEQPDAVFKKFFYRNSLDYLNTRKRIAKGGLPSPLVAHLRQLQQRK